MAPRLLSSYWGTHLIESHCKESNISVTNWLFDQNLVECMASHLANLHILKTLISLERKETFKNSKHHFSSYTGHLFRFKMTSIGKMRFSS